MLLLFPKFTGARRRVALVFAAFFLPALLFPPAALAQQTVAPPPASMTELSMEQLMDVDVPTVYGASKYLQSIAEAPASVTVITAEEIKIYGYRNFAEILQSVPGLSMSYDRNYNYVGIRGFSRPGDYNTRVLLLIDGIRINDNIFDEAPLGNDLPLDIDLIDRVEIIQGPSHSLYGSNAFFGVINVITRNGRSLKGAELSAEGGSFATYKGRFSYGGKFAGGMEALVSGSLLDSKGQNLYYPEFNTPAQNNGWAIGCDGEGYGNLFLKLRYRDFTLEGGYVRRRKNVPTASFDTVFDTPLNKTVDTRAFGDLNYQHEYDNRLSLMARLSYNSYYYDGDYVEARSNGNVVNKDYSRGDTVASELQITKELQRHKLVGGVEIRGNVRQGLKNYDSGGVYLDDRRSSYSWGAYAQDELSLLDDLVLHAGIRYDHFQTFGGTFNPRLALVYSPLADTTVKLIYGRAFRAPNSYELYYATPPDYLSNPSLKEETDTSLELLFQQGLGANLTGTATAFYNRASNVISQTGRADGYHIFQNIDDYSTRGLILELQGKWRNGVQGRASYTLQQAKPGGTGSMSTVPNSPRQLAKLNLIVPLLPGKAFLGLEEQFTDSRKTVSGPDAPQFFLSNLTLFSQQLIKGVELSASVYNLFDQRHLDPGSQDHLEKTIAQDGRTFRLKATYAF